MKKPKYILLIIPVLFAYALSSCSEEPDGPCSPSNSYFTITPEARAKTPYFDNPDFDTISFASNTGDTLSFALTDIDTTWYVEDVQQRPNGCPIYQNYQVFSISYLAIRGSSYLKVRLSQRWNGRSGPTINIRMSNFDFTYDIGTIGRNNYIYYVGDYSLFGYTYKETFYEFNKDIVENDIKGYFNEKHGLFFIDDATTTYYLIP